MISGGEQLSFRVDANLNQHVEPYSGAPPGTLKEIINLRKSRDGELVKRQGYTALTATPGARSAVRGFEYNDQSVFIDDTAVHVYTEAGSKWAVADRAPNWTLDNARQLEGDSSGWTTDPLQPSYLNSTTGFRMYPGCATGGNIVVHVWVYKENGLAIAETVSTPNPIQERHGVYMMVTDEKTGAVIRPPQRISTAATGTDVISLARVTYASGYFWFVWSVIPAVGDFTGTTAGSLWALCVSSASLADPTTTIAAGVVVKTDYMRNSSFQTPAVASAMRYGTFDISASTYSSVPFCYVAYTRDSSGTRTVSAFRIDTAITSVTPSTTVASAVGQAVSIYASTTDLWVAYVLPATSQTTVYIDRLDPITQATSGSANIALTTGEDLVSTGLCGWPGSSTSVMLVMTGQDRVVKLRSGVIACIKYNLVASVPTFVSADIRYDLVAASQPFSNGRDVYIWAEVGGSGDNAVYLPTTVEWIAYSSTVLISLTHDGGSMYQSAASPPQMRVAAGKTNWGQYADRHANQEFATCHAPQKVWTGTADTDNYYWDGSTVLVPHEGAAINGYLYYAGAGATAVTEYRIRSVKTANSAAHIQDYGGGLAICSGGTMLNQFDGRQFTEVGFCTLPWVQDIATSAAGGTAVSSGNYTYALVYEYTDSAGNVHQSQPVVKNYTVATGSTNKVTFTVRALNVTVKQDYENTFRGTVTTAAPNSCVQIVLYRSLSGPSQQLYRVTSVLNPYGTDVATIDDVYSDSAIGSGPLLYTVTGELVNECPPTATHAVTFNNRIALIDAEHGERVVFSKPLLVGLGPSFSGALETYVRGIGKLTALAAMDGTLYAFSKTAVAIAAYGDGQDALGTGSWPQPQIISRAAGCVDARALCLTQEGIVFCSKRGDADSSSFAIWLLPRGGGDIVEIGKKVRNYLNGRGYSVIGTADTSSQMTKVLSCVNWVNESRVVINAAFANGVTMAMEYDYAHRGEDGQGVWNTTSCTADTSYTMACTWVAGGRHWQGVQTANGFVARSTANVFADSTLGGSLASIVYAVETHRIKLGSLAPRGKLNFVNVEFNVTYGAVSQNSGIRITVAGDAAGATASSIITINNQGGTRIRREWAPPFRRDDVGNGVSVRVENIVAALAADRDNKDPIPALIHLDYVPTRGMRRPTSAEVV